MQANTDSMPVDLKRKRDESCPYIDNEAEHSGDDSESDDSLIVESADESDDDVEVSRDEYRAFDNGRMQQESDEEEESAESDAESQVCVTDRLYFDYLSKGIWEISCYLCFCCILHQKYSV